MPKCQCTKCKEVAKLREAIAMADNRLEAALLGEPGDAVCRDCVEVARSYLSPHLP